MSPTDLPAIASFAIKILTILGFGIYVLFAAVMVRQEHLMSDVLEEGFEPVLRLLVYAHLLAAIAVIGLAFFIL
jgi:hypothetical protein